LGGAGQGHLTGDFPDRSTRDVRGVRAPGHVLADPRPAYLLQLLQHLQVDAFVVDHVAAGVGAGHHDPTELLHLLDRVDRHVAGAGHHHPLAVQAVPVHAQHLFGEEDGAVPGGLPADLGTAVAEPLTGQHPRLVPVGDPLVLAEQVADLPGTHPDVSGRYVGVLPDVPVELGHERLAEPHHLPVGAALGVEVCPALTAADRHPGQRVLEQLLEPEDLDDPQVHRGVETQAALVRTERTVELHPEASVDVHLAPVVLPRDPENDLSFGLADPLDDLCFGVLRVPLQRRYDAVQDLPYGLVELVLTRVAPDHGSVDLLDPVPC